MKRLRDVPAHSPLLANVQRMIRAAPQITDSPEPMLRVRRAIEETPARGASGFMRAPAFAVAGTLLLFGASAFAAVRVWIEHHPASDRSAAELLSVPAAPQTGSRVPVVTDEPVLQLAAADSPASLVAPAAADASAVREPAPRARRFEDGRKTHRGYRRHKLTRAGRKSSSRPAPTAVASLDAAPKVSDTQLAAVETPAASTATPSPARSAERSEEREPIPEPAKLSRAEKRSSDSELVVRAVETLRRDHEPAVAAGLLEQYRARNPRGVLAEEVLSLQIEAAGAANDPRAHSFAREYLSRYPDGRYRERAERALGGAAP
jgi:hypothetical protein